MSDPLFVDAAWELTKERGVGCWLRREEIEERMLTIRSRKPVAMPPIPKPVAMPPIPKPMPPIPRPA